MLTGEKVWGVIAQIRLRSGPLGYLPLILTIPLIFAVSFVALPVFFATGVLLALVRAVVGERASSRYDTEFNRAYYVISVGVVVVFFLSKLEELTRGWTVVNLPGWIAGYLIYLGILWVIVLVYGTVFYSCAKLLTRFPALQYVVLAVVVFAVVAGLSSRQVRECDVSWTQRGPVCE